MSIWSGRRRALTILAFIAPTIIGIMIFNIYPIIFNTYISLTNRNQFHPNPDCSVFLTGIIEPSCWPVFRAHRTTGVGQPFRLQEPILGNYSYLLGQMFSGDSLLALLRIILVFVPLFVANWVNKRLDRQVSRPMSSLTVWFLAVLAAILIALLVNLGGAYQTLMNSGDFFVVVSKTVIYVALSIPTIFILALATALILNSPFVRWRTFFRTVVIIPWAASSMAIMMALIWQFFFRSQGTINQVLGLFGINGPAWLLIPNLALGVIILVNLWFTFPFFVNVILGALQSIPTDQYEAAEVDGASFFQQLTHITLPLIRPAVLPAVILSAIGAGGFQMFGTAWAITQGGPSQGAGRPGFTELVMVYAFKQVFQSNAYARAGAFAVIIFIFLFAATFYTLRLTRITKGAYE